MQDLSVYLILWIAHIHHNADKRWLLNDQIDCLLCRSCNPKGILFFEATITDGERVGKLRMVARRPLTEVPHIIDRLHDTHSVSLAHAVEADESRHRPIVLVHRRDEVGIDAAEAA